MGEKLEENETGKTEEVITAQIRESLADIKCTSEIMVAYEPIWAIGTGKAATGKQSNETIGIIRHNLALMYGQNIAGKVRILYGGSVTADNIAEFIEHNQIDGALVGGASLKPDQFISI